MESVWENGIPRKRFDSLEGNKTTDVLIVGGGIAGILCAYKLKNAGIDCILAEACEICNGVTKNTTAKITIGHSLVYDTFIKRFGEDKARLYLSAQVKAMEEYAHICNNIDCDYEVKDSYVYSVSNRKIIEQEVKALNRLGFNAEFTKDTELPIDVAGAVKTTSQAQFHPLKFLFYLAKDLPIYENTKVTQLLPNKAITNRGEIMYKRLVIATHFPIINKHGLYPLKLFQHRSYVLALKDAQKVNGMYVDESDKGMSFRNFGDMLLLGGGGHRTGKNGGCWHELEEFVNKHYKDAKIVGKWATQDCMTLDRVPYIGQYSKSLPNVFVATGFNKWGMTNAMVAANVLCDVICNKPSVYEEVFSPSRTILRPQLAVNALESIIGLLTPTTPRCPHLGCALKYNHTEHSWDCSCHGSRFAVNGELINNPATDDLKLD